jgi:regulator of sigma E protease
LTMFLYILAALFMLGILIMIHELGHFLSARLCGIPVKQFSIGFGPKLIRWTSKKHETAFALRAIPVGGFCMFYGEDDVKESEKEDPRNISLYSAWKRMLTIFMGPMMNFILAFVICLCYFTALGVPKPDRTVVYAVETGSPAELAGLEAEDTILSINGHLITDNLTEYVSQYKSGDSPLAVVAEHKDGQTETLGIIPAFNAGENRYLLGITINVLVKFVPGTIGEVAAESYGFCVSVGGEILNSLRSLVTTGQGFKDMSGPVGVVTFIARETAAGSWQAYFSLMVMISVNLGLINLLPVPGLDGSRILFLLVEMVRRKRISPQKEAYVHMAGFVLLIGLMLLFTYQDILRLF